MSDDTLRASVLSFHEPKGPAPRGTLVVVPGRGEQPAVYTRFGQRLAFDAYRIHVVGDPTVDPEHVKRQVERAADAGVAPAPVVLVGSDTGAIFAAALLADRQLENIDALILAGLPNPETPVEAADSWDEELDARTTCPTHRGRISDSLVTPGALYEPIPGDWTQQTDLSQIEQPILAFHGQEDPISAIEWARDLYGAARAAELVSIGGARHDVLNDQTHRTVAATTVLWLERLRAGNGLAPIARSEPVGADIV
jgi:alpha-beta hydrolase superfamily lysophospholipase